MGRHLKATIITGVLAAVLLAPIAYMRYLDQTTRPVDEDKLGAVAPFILRDVNGVPLTQEDLDGHITVVANLGGCATGCTAERALLARLSTWIHANLVYAGEYEKTPIQLVTVAPPEVAVDAPWRHVAATGADLATFLPQGHGEAQPSVSVVDQERRFRYNEPLTQGDALLAQLEPYLSRLVMNHYMRDYLAKRTFFDVKPKSASHGS